MTHYQDSRAAAQKRLVEELAKPLADGVAGFDPWSLLPGIYGSYCQEFDDCAIDVLNEILSGEKERRDLGAEMFREMLCVQGFCDYGTSPRVCFWSMDDNLLPTLIERWREWSALHWGGEE